MHASLPVMVYLHGGSWAYGSAEIFDGSALAAEGNVIVVVPNYRLGPLGWLALPNNNGASNQPDAVANLGAYDHASALRFVQVFNTLPSTMFWECHSQT